MLQMDLFGKNKNDEEYEKSTREVKIIIKKNGIMEVGIMKRRFAPLYLFMAVFTALLLAVSSAVYTVKARLASIETAGAGTSLTRSLPIYSVAREDKKIAISFDCAHRHDFWSSAFPSKHRWINRGQILRVLVDRSLNYRGFSSYIKH